jgi:hypothetical protein
MRPQNDLSVDPATYPVCNGDNTVSGFSFQLLETKDRKEPSFIISFKPAAPA